MQGFQASYCFSHCTREITTRSGVRVGWGRVGRIDAYPHKQQGDILNGSWSAGSSLWSHLLGKAEGGKL